ncbi:zinc finger MYND domain-containing protein 15-like [Hypomesus transpacificus]|uniref:zinc finger MYND domain-containing protein 15-like n=1 Tax=Hypomesus transpacificus TaxID=137520 RepID=UPI001F07E78F|nr:zinc finger MYND domain-containing protein 15-like [Hypomesus transpacificus]
MELVSGYRDPLIEFSEAMAQWYRCFQTTRNGRNRDKHTDGEFWGYGFPRYPVDRSPYWILHLLDCTTPPPAARPRLEQANVDPSELNRLSSSGESILMVTDASGLPLGFDVLPCGWASSLGGGEVAGGDGEGMVGTLQRMVGLLRRCMEAPMSGGLPRRPLTLRVNDRKLHRLLSRSSKALSILKVALWPHALGGWDPAQVEEEGVQAAEAVSFSMRWPPTLYCHVCKKHSFPSQLKPCSQCRAVLYCSDQCAHSDRTRCPDDTSHEHWCGKLATFMANGPLLTDSPFTYAEEVAAHDFDLEHFLFKNKLDCGYWVHWSLLVRSPRYELHHRMEQSKDPYPQWLAGWYAPVANSPQTITVCCRHREPYGPLIREGEILLCNPAPRAPSLTKPLVSWRQYCDWRGLGLSSLVAPLLSSPLSIYYIITSLVPKHFPELNILKKQSLKIHIIESYREFHSLVVFWELSMLLPHMTFELVFIGEGLPAESDEVQLFLQKKNGTVTFVNPSLTPDEKVDRRSLRVKGYRRAYHMLQGPKPDLVIGFRPMIPLHESWLSTLPRLQSLRVPAYFCEVSELSCECSLQVMSQATGGAVSTPHINPFHCPLRITGGDNMLPWYSNAFIFHLVYKPVASFLQRPMAANSEDPYPQDEPTNRPLENPPKMTRKERKHAARYLPRKRK